MTGTEDTYYYQRFTTNTQYWYHYSTYEYTVPIPPCHKEISTIETANRMNVIASTDPYNESNNYNPPAPKTPNLHRPTTNLQYLPNNTIHKEHLFIYNITTAN